MSNWPIAGGTPRVTSYLGAFTETAVALNRGATANTKGAWVEVFASTAFDIAGIDLMFTSPGGSGGWNFLVEVGVGAAGAEQVILPDICGWAEWPGRPYQATGIIPLWIPAGSRVSLRLQHSHTTNGLTAGFIMSAWGESPLGVVPPDSWITLGSDPSLSRGIDLLSGALAHTYGSWTEMVASAPRRLSRLMLVWTTPGRTMATSTERNKRIQIGVGASGSEVALFEDAGIFHYEEATGDQVVPWVIGPWPVDIPAGTRISARIRSQAPAGTGSYVLLGA